MRRRVRFFDADDFHPAENVAKMRSGVPLTDADRLPWLQHLADLLARAEAPTALACSALKAGYRDRIASGCPHAFFVHLAGAPEVIRARISARVGHYMPPSLLESQFGALEAPAGSAGSITLDCERSVEDLCAAVLAGLARRDEAASPPCL